MLEHSLDSHVIEKVGVVLNREIQTVGPLRSKQHQIKFRRSAFGSYALKLQSTKIKLLSGCILKDKCYLKERRMTEAAFRLHCIDESFEWQVLMRISLQRRLTDSCQQFQKSRIPGKIR